MSEGVKIVEGINKEEKCGFCACVQFEGHPDVPTEDIVALCVGELNEDGHPKRTAVPNLRRSRNVGHGSSPSACIFCYVQQKR